MRVYGKRWEKLRAAILKRDGYRSQLASRYGIARPAEVVHHILPVEFFPEYRYKAWNLISVTTAEHNRLHERGTHQLADEGMRLALKTARLQGMDLAEIQDRMKGDPDESRRQGQVQRQRVERSSAIRQG